jgi:hypothetical protein
LPDNPAATASDKDVPLFRGVAFIGGAAIERLPVSWRKAFRGNATPHRYQQAAQHHRFPKNANCHFIFEGLTELKLLTLHK